MSIRSVPKSIPLAFALALAVDAAPVGSAEVGSEVSLEEGAFYELLRAFVDSEQQRDAAIVPQGWQGSLDRLAQFFNFPNFPNFANFQNFPNCFNGNWGNC